MKLNKAFYGLLSGAIIIILFICISTPIIAEDNENAKEFIMWILGERVTGSITKENQNCYDVAITYSDGKTVNASCFGDDETTIDSFIDIYRNIAEVEKNDDNKVFFYYRDSCIDITDRFRPWNVWCSYPDETGKDETLLLSEYCYFEYENQYHTIIHIVNIDKSEEEYTVFTYQGDFQKAGIGDALTPSYAEYCSFNILNYDVNVYTNQNDLIMEYMDESLIINDKLTEISTDTMTVQNGNDWIHPQSFSYAFIKIKDQFVSLYLYTFFDGTEINEAVGWRTNNAGFLPLNIGNIEITPDGYQS